MAAEKQQRRWQPQHQPLVYRRREHGHEQIHNSEDEPFNYLPQWLRERQLFEQKRLPWRGLYASGRRVRPRPAPHGTRSWHIDPHAPTPRERIRQIDTTYVAQAGRAHWRRYRQTVYGGYQRRKRNRKARRLQPWSRMWWYKPSIPAPPGAAAVILADAKI